VDCGGSPEQHRRRVRVSVRVTQECYEFSAVAQVAFGAPFADHAKPVEEELARPVRLGREHGGLPGPDQRHDLGHPERLVFGGNDGRSSQPKAPVDVSAEDGE
jgi:hypothetical protein